jgi:hypothetical protein
VRAVSWGADGGLASRLLRWTCARAGTDGTGTTRRMKSKDLLATSSPNVDEHTTVAQLSSTAAPCFLVYGFARFSVPLQTDAFPEMPFYLLEIDNLNGAMV